jgi:small subunit ribosomal protein S21
MPKPAVYATWLACDNHQGRCAISGSTARTNPNRIGGEYNVAEVIIQESESLENALRRFKRKVQQEDIKKHSFYMKPGEKRRAKEALSRKRLRKKQRREAD